MNAQSDGDWERREDIWISDEQFERLVQRATEAAVPLAAIRVKTEIEDELYADLGRAVARAFLYALGAGAVAFLTWAGVPEKVIKAMLP